MLSFVSFWSDAIVRAYEPRNDCVDGPTSIHPWAVSDFKELKVWQKAHALALAVDRAANSNRAVAYASLRSQMIRAAMSIDANIAEGRGHRSDKELTRFLRISVASAYELESHLIMARDRHFLKEPDF